MPNVTYCEQVLIDGVVGKGDADISGPGVITAFLASGLITMLVISVAYVVGLVDAGLLRPVDRIILRVPSQAERYSRTHVALRRAVIALSDQQIITGIAVLGAGFQGLRAGTISVYHFQIVIYLAWMSSSVNLSALTLLRPFLWQHRGLMIWRIIGMLTLACMLIIALVPTLSNDWAVAATTDDWQDSPQNGFGIPAICFWGELYGDGVNPDAVLAFIILIISYVWKMGGLFTPIRDGYQSYVRSPIDTFLEWPLMVISRKYKQEQRRTWVWLLRMYLCFWLPATAILEIMSSFSAALWLSVLGTIYGAMQILIPRAIVRRLDPSIEAHESEFGFGQLIALILLIQPLGAVTEHIWVVGQDDELVYGAKTEAGGEAGDLIAHAVKTQEPLLAILPEASRIQLRARIYQSWVFAALVWWTHLGIGIVAGFTFVIDGISIGWDVTANWYFIGIASAAFVGATGVLLLTIVPFSRLAGPCNRRASHALETKPPNVDSGEPTSPTAAENG